MMTTRKMARSGIARLNASALRILRTMHNGATGAAAVREAAHQAGLEAVKVSDDAIVYRTPRGKLVNAWLEGPSLGSVIGDGGAGFDNQIDWAFM
jgi:hypothetical protein